MWTSHYSIVVKTGPVRLVGPGTSPMSDLEYPGNRRPVIKSEENHRNRSWIGETGENHPVSRFSQSGRIQKRKTQNRTKNRAEIARHGRAYGQRRWHVAMVVATTGSRLLGGVQTCTVRLRWGRSEIQNMNSEIMKKEEEKKDCRNSYRRGLGWRRKEIWKC